MMIPMRTADRHAASLADLGTIQTFVAVAEAGSLAAGGKALGMTRSAASKAIARLEAHLGARLLHRTTRRLVLTADGQNFYERCVQILHDLSEAEASVRPDRAMPKGTLRLTASASYGRTVILPFLQQAMQAWPGLEVEISFSDRIVDLVEEGFDLGIRVGALPAEAQWVARRISQARPGLYAAPAYLENGSALADVEALQQCERLIYGLRPGPTAWRLVRHAADSEERVVIDGPARLRFDSGEAIHQAVLAGLGVAYLPSFTVAPDVQAGRLVQLFPDYEGEGIPIHAVYPNRRHLAAKVRLFIDQLVAYLRADGE